MCKTGRLYLTLILALTVGGCGESSSPESATDYFSSVTSPDFLIQYKEDAKSGDAQAQFQVGELLSGDYSISKGIANDAEAAEWYQRAAAQGHAEAQLKLGLRYYLGKGVLKSTAKAIDLLQKSAAQDNVDAQFKLGIIYATGGGVLKDTAKAVHWFQKAAAQGDTDAKYNLGVCYAIGEGVPKDGVLAYTWFNLATVQGAERMSHGRNSHGWASSAAEERDSIELNLDQRAEAERLSLGWKLGQVLRREAKPASNDERIMESQPIPINSEPRQYRLRGLLEPDDPRSLSRTPD